MAIIIFSQSFDDGDDMYLEYALENGSSLETIMEAVREYFCDPDGSLKKNQIGIGYDSWNADEKLRDSVLFEYDKKQVDDGVLPIPYMLHMARKTNMAGRPIEKPTPNK